MIAHAWFRSGNTGTSRGVVPFLKEALALLPPGHQLYAVRADSGFCHNDLLSFLERIHIACAVSGRSNPMALFKRQILKTGEPILERLRSALCRRCSLWLGQRKIHPESCHQRPPAIKVPAAPEAPGIHNPNCIAVDSHKGNPMTSTAFLGIKS